MTTDDRVTLPDHVEERLFDILHGEDATLSGDLDALCTQFPAHAEEIRERAAGGTPQSLASARPAVPSDDCLEGKCVGPYRLLECVGRGGMGEVYRAERHDVMRQVVALKLVRPGLADRSVLARFGLERRALAAMNHRSIAKIYDAGATESGDPYFVMEFVDGVPITNYCRGHRLGLAERLRIFRQVCLAVQHAHQKGVVHRDLKPDNILVVREGDDAVPKILDFGIAKATNRQLVPATMFTENDRILGTLEYMSPEQTGGHGEVVDVRADVYSLGVILYEIVSGVLPFPPSVLRSAGLERALRMIRETEPVSPSVRVTRGPLAVGEVCDPVMAGSAHRLRGEVDWIIGKAMHKIPERRYDSAGSLATDLQRYLNDQPVFAGPPSARYRLAKLVRRHRIAVLGSVVAAIAMLAVVGATGAWDAERRLRGVFQDVERVEQGLDALVPLVPADAPRLRRLLDRARAVVDNAPAPGPVAVPDEAATEVARSTAVGARLWRDVQRLEGELAAAVADALTPSSRRRGAPYGAVRRHVAVLRDDLARLSRGIEAGEPLAFHLHRLRLIRDRGIPALEARLGLLEARTAADQATRWRDVQERLAADRRFDRGLRPDSRLDPLGPDPESGLEEFAFVGLGYVPRRDSSEQLRVGEPTTIVFVLVPAIDGECDPFLLAKHELSRAQWQCMAIYFPSRDLRETSGLDVRDLGGPAEPATAVSGIECSRLARCFGFRLPTPREWMHAATAGGAWPRSGAEAVANANVRDLDFLDHRAVVGPGEFVGDDVAPIHDGYAEFAPVWSGAANPWGFHHVMGNVAEWSAAVDGSPVRSVLGNHWDERPAWIDESVPAIPLRSVPRVETALDRTTGVRLALTPILDAN